MDDYNSFKEDHSVADKTTSVTREYQEDGLTIIKSPTGQLGLQYDRF
jgi:hypothetical protein